jgi:small GTP-binding protein
MDKLPNLVFIGDATVGKSTIITYLSNHTHDKTIKSTIGAALKNYRSEDFDIDIMIWDTAGQERFDSLIPGYLRKADIVALVLDISRYTYLDFRNQMSKHVSNIIRSVKKDFHLIIILNKCDMVSPLLFTKIERSVREIFDNVCSELIYSKDSTESSQYYKDRFSDMRIIITSALEGIGFQNLNETISIFSNRVERKDLINAIGKVEFVEIDKKTSECFC